MILRRFTASFTFTVSLLITRFKKKAAFKLFSKLRLTLNSFKLFKVLKILVFNKNVLFTFTVVVFTYNFLVIIIIIVVIIVVFLI